MLNFWTKCGQFLNIKSPVLCAFSAFGAQAPQCCHSKLQTSSLNSGRLRLQRSKVTIVYRFAPKDPPRELLVNVSAWRSGPNCTGFLSVRTQTRWESCDDFRWAWALKRMQSVSLWSKHCRYCGCDTTMRESMYIYVSCQQPAYRASPHIFQVPQSKESKFLSCIWYFRLSKIFQPEAQASRHQLRSKGRRSSLDVWHFDAWRELCDKFNKSRVVWGWQQWQLMMWGMLPSFLTFYMFLHVLFFAGQQQWETAMHIQFGSATSKKKTKQQPAVEGPGERSWEVQRCHFFSRSMR